MGEITDVTRGSFKHEVLEEKRPVLVDFWAHWSGPCRHLEPVLDKIAEQTADVKLCRVNVEREPELAGLYHVAATPTLMLFEHGRQRRVSTGSRSEQDVRNFLGGPLYESLD